MRLAERPHAAQFLREVLGDFRGFHEGVAGSGENRRSTACRAIPQRGVEDDRRYNATVLAPAEREKQRMACAEQPGDHGDGALDLLFDGLEGALREQLNVVGHSGLMRLAGGQLPEGGDGRPAANGGKKWKVP